MPHRATAPHRARVVVAGGLARLRMPQLGRARWSVARVRIRAGLLEDSPFARTAASARGCDLARRQRPGLPECWFPMEPALRHGAFVAGTEGRSRGVGEAHYGGPVAAASQAAAG